MCGDQTSWDEFARLIDDLIGSGKPKLVHFIDYYLKEGGTYFELQNRIKEKAAELNQKGYSFTNDMLYENRKPKQRSFIIEAFRGEKRMDPVSESESEPITGQTHYLPIKEDCD